MTWQEMFATLLKFYNGRQYNMKIVHAGPVGGNRYLYASARYWCTARPYRTWEARADAYAMLQGVIYGGSFAYRNNLYCG